MELRTQALDRLLEALSPALSTEMDRILEEFRQQLEEDFQIRLKAALRDAELETLHLAEVRQEEAALEAREAMRVQLTDDFTIQLNFAVEQVRSSMKAKFDEELLAAKAKADEDMQSTFANWAAERSLIQDQLSQWRTYADAQRQLSECTSQAGILSLFLKLSEPFAGSLAIYVSKSDGLDLWASRGPGAFPKQISPGTIDPDVYFKPAVVRDRMVAAACAARPCKAESLDFLMSCLERSIEAFGLKLQTRNPRLPATESVTERIEEKSHHV